MYRPLTSFMIIGMVPFFIGMVLGIRFLVFMAMHDAMGHVQSLILASTLLMLGFITWLMGIMADTVASNRKILEDVQKHVRNTDYEISKLNKVNVKLPNNLLIFFCFDLVGLYPLIQLMPLCLLENFLLKYASPHLDFHAHSVFCVPLAQSLAH